MIMRRFCVLPLLALAVSAPGAKADQPDQLIVNGQARTFLLHVPAALAGPAPLLLAYHGAGQTAALFTKITGFDDLADQRGFIVAYPQGLGRRWNAGLSAGLPDDIAFTRMIIRAVQASHAISRIYAAGFSNGGMFANSLACANQVPLAGIAAVGGLMTVEASTRCTAAAPLPVLEIAAHGDPIMPYRGGLVWVLGPPGNTVLSYAATLALWAKIDRCAAPPGQSFDSARAVNQDDATSCAAGKPVRGIAIKSHIHSWSGHDEPYPIDTSTTVVDFLLSH